MDKALATVNEQATQLRSELAELRHDLAKVEKAIDPTQAGLLLEANQHLVLAAIQAEAIAARAASHLSALVESGDQNAQDLRNANEQLMIAAVHSQEQETTALEAHRRQIGFLATVAHELRNPLMPLRLAAVMLDRARTDEVAYSRHQATITGQVAQMTRLIGDLLEGSRIATGEFRLERSLVDMSTVLRRAIEACQPAMDARRQRFTTDVPSDPVMVLGDTVRLMQVFGNLLENASKYTPEGGEISLRSQALGDVVTIIISDNGIGITAQALPRVFEMFVRDAHAAAADSGGLGIGLAVVRELVHAHEGTVTAASAGRGQGSTFVISLPVQAGTGHPATAPV